MGEFKMTINRTTVKIIIPNIVAFLFFFNVLNVAYFLPFGYTRLMWWTLIVPFFLMVFVRTKNLKLPVFVAAHIVIVAVSAFLIGDALDWQFISIFMIAACIYSFASRNLGEREPDFSSIVIFLFLYIFLFILAGVTEADSTDIHLQLISGYLMMVALIVLYMHMDNFDMRLKLLQQIDERNHNTEKIMKANNFLIVVYVMIILSINAPVLIAGRLISYMPDWRSNVWVPGDGMTEPEPVIHDEIFGVYVENWWADLELPEYAEPVPAFEHLPLVITFYEDMAAINIFGILVMFAAFILLGLIAYLFYKFFNFNKFKKPEDDGDGDISVALARSFLSDLRELSPRFKINTRNPIRRAYIKKVRFFIKHGVDIKKSDTTDIIAGKIRELENIDELTAKYEDVRYHLEG